MKFTQSLLFVSVATIAACSAESPSADGQPTEDELGSSLSLSETAAVRFSPVDANPNDLITVGVPKKVADVLGAVRKSKSSDPRPRCMPTPHQALEFLDAKGAALAAVTLDCAGFGQLTYSCSSDRGVRCPSPVEIKADSAKLAKTRDADLALGDFLWGTSKVNIMRTPGGGKLVSSEADVKKVLDAVRFDDPRQIPDPNASSTRCTNRSLTFFRHDEELGRLSYNCDSVVPEQVNAMFLRGATPIARRVGGVNIAPRAIEQLLAAE